MLAWSGSKRQPATLGDADELQKLQLLACGTHARRLLAELEIEELLAHPLPLSITTSTKGGDGSFVRSL
jgi:hypothetical protein